MLQFDDAGIERFQVEKNTIRLTPRFDPRYQPRAGAELMSILHGLASECQEGELILDMRDAASVPSMMLGLLDEAREMALKAGKRLRVKMAERTYRRLETLGALKSFRSCGEGGSQGGEFELVVDGTAAKKEFLKYPGS